MGAAKYEAWSACMDACAKVERERKALRQERIDQIKADGGDWVAALDALDAELDETHPWPTMDEFPVKDYIGVTTARDSIQWTHHPGTKGKPTPKLSKGQPMPKLSKPPRRTVEPKD